MSGRKAPKSENSFHGMASALKRRYSHSLALNFSYKTAISEVVGVAGFVLVGCGVAALVTAPDTYSGGQYVSRMLNSSIVGLAFGFGIFFMISATAHNNSDQLNPAITLALIASGSTPLLQGSINICAQVLGAIIGAGFLRALLPGSFAGESTLGANSVPVDVSRGQAFLGALPLLLTCEVHGAWVDNHLRHAVCAQPLGRASDIVAASRPPFFAAGQCTAATISAFDNLIA